MAPTPPRRGVVPLIAGPSVLRRGGGRRRGADRGGDVAVEVEAVDGVRVGQRRREAAVLKRRDDDVGDWSPVEEDMISSHADVVRRRVPSHGGRPGRESHHGEV